MILTVLLTTNLFTLTPAMLDAVADKIYTVEGGARAKVPYGILSVHVRDAVEARWVCELTVWHAYSAWSAAEHRQPFVDYLADRYCPPSADTEGNSHWKRNMRKLLSNNR
jgi:hypothetical protein